MKNIATLFGAILALMPSALASAKQDAGIAVLEKLGTEAIRMADSDLCLPANADEYEALGKNGVLRIEASSAISSELPINAAYLEIKGLQFPLTRIVAFDKFEDEKPATSKGTRYWHQVAFYRVPLNLIKQSSRLVIDFRGARRGFGVTTFTPSTDRPAFVRLDEYNTPSEPDGAALAALLAREYPNDFPDRN